MNQNSVSYVRKCFQLRLMQKYLTDYFETLTDYFEAGLCCLTHIFCEHISAPVTQVDHHIKIISIERIILNFFLVFF